MSSDKATKNSLSIRLSESAVFVRPSDGSSRRRSIVAEAEAPASLIRGLLTLEIVKPTKISSIDLELTGKTSTSWPEGVGARRIEITEEHKVFYATANYFRAANSSRRTASIGPGAKYPDDNNTRQDISARGRHARGSSVDRTVFQTETTENSHLADAFILETPPYTPFPTSPNSPAEQPPQLSRNPSSFHLDSGPAQALEHSRNTLYAELHHDHTSPSRSRSSYVLASSSSSVRSQRESVSRRQSHEAEAENDALDVHQSISPHRAGQRIGSGSGSGTASGTASPNPDGRDRGRGHSRFSLSAVSNILMDVVRTRSGSRRRESSTPRDPSGGRPGRFDEDSELKLDTPKDRSAFSKLLRKDDGKTSGETWKEFKKGTYTYAISIPIPGNSPPTLRTPFGSVIWRLKGTVHRPGAFTSKLTAFRTVLVIASPSEDDTDDTDNIIVERQWDSQLQYLISIAGRSFYIGGTIPIQITLMPLAKVKIHRISVFIEERIDYYTAMKRIARTDAVGHTQLLLVKQTDPAKLAKPILPLEMDAHFSESPLYDLLAPDDDSSEMASNFMGPGPWNFHKDLPLPTSCEAIHVTNKNRKSNIVIKHTLKVVFRVERGDDEQIDPKTGKRKMFDIVVQSGVNVLSCRCNPEWSSLPTYTETFEDDTADMSDSLCPCKVAKQQEEARHRPSALERMMSHRSSESSASSVESATIAVNPASMPSLRPGANGFSSLFQQNSLYESLISGQVSETGEAPPAYSLAGGSLSTRGRVVL